MDCCQPWAEKMGLSDEQMEKLVSLKSEYMVKTAPQKAELMSDMKQMMLLMTAPSLDKQAIMSLHDKMSSIKSDLCTARVNHMISAMEVLTSKQRSDMHHHMLVHMSVLIICTVCITTDCGIITVIRKHQLPSIVAFRTE